MSEPLDIKAFEAKMTIAEKYAGLINGELAGRGVCLLDRELTEMVTARIDEALQEHSSAEVERLRREREGLEDRLKEIIRLCSETLGDKFFSAIAKPNLQAIYHIARTATTQSDS